MGEIKLIDGKRKKLFNSQSFSLPTFGMRYMVFSGLPKKEENKASEAMLRLRSDKGMSLQSIVGAESTRNMFTGT